MRANKQLQPGAFFKALSVLAWIALSGCNDSSGQGGFLTGPNTIHNNGGSTSTSGNGGNNTGSGGNTGTGGNTGNSNWKPGVFQPSATFVAQCASPRTGNDPLSGKPYPDVKGSTLSENNWLRSWTNELYLWFDQVTDADPSLSSTPDYFNLMKTMTQDAAGKPTDKFHFTYPTSTWETLSTSNVQAGYGVQWVLLASTPPRKLVVAYTTPNTPATAANLARGAQILTIDGVDLVNANDQQGINTLNAGISPATVGETHTFTVQDLNSATTRSITLTSQNITSKSVGDQTTTVPTSTGTVGYLILNDFQATAEAELITAINQLQMKHVNDLVLDLRYNGGGLLDIASELAYMIAGPAGTAGRTFYTQQFNSKNPTTNPVTGTAIAPIGFHNTTQGFSSTGQPLPSLNLGRVFVLTGPSTCSASEAVMNGLEGANIKVYQIGSTTCGKPYGFYPQDNCGTTYFSIEFRGVNGAGFGTYPEGFSPSNSATQANGATLPGCQVADDFTHDLGDPAEARLGAAVNYSLGTMCPAPSGMAGTAKNQLRSLSATDGLVVRPAVREILILRQ
jgi:hypothetical protein